MGVSLNHLIELISEVTGLSTEVNYLAGRDFDVRSIVLDTSKITQECGWNANTDLRKGIQQMFDSLSGSLNN